MATYTSTATGIWSAGATWVGGVKPPSGAGHKIVIAAGHTVTYDEAAGTYGDDTSSTTSANNAIVVNGTLKFSRSTSTQLTCRGTLFVATNGTLDAGSTADVRFAETGTLLLLSGTDTPATAMPTATRSMADPRRSMRRITPSVRRRSIRAITASASSPTWRATA